MYKEANMLLGDIVKVIGDNRNDARKLAPCCGGFSVANICPIPAVTLFLSQNAKVSEEN